MCNDHYRFLLKISDINNSGSILKKLDDLNEQVVIFCNRITKNINDVRNVVIKLQEQQNEQATAILAAASAEAQSGVNEQATLQNINGKKVCDSLFLPNLISN